MLLFPWQCIQICSRYTVTVHRTLWWWSTPESVVAKIKNVLPITVFVHYMSTLYSYLYCYAFKWQFSVILYVVYIMFEFLVIFLKYDLLIFFGRFFENYSRKTTKDRDVTFSPVVATCKFCQIRWFVMMWLHIEPLQPVSCKKMCCVRRKSSNRTYHITVFIYIRYISSKLPYLINEYSC